MRRYIMEAILFASLPTRSLDCKTLNWGLRSRRIRPRPCWIRTRILRFPIQTRCLAVESRVNDERTRTRQDVLRVSEMAVTMTVVSLALPQAAAFAAIAEKKRTNTVKEVEVMTPEERAAWTQGLPFVQERIPYTDVLKLKSEGRLKYIIKHPNTLPKARPDVILLVLDDDRVVRTVLPVADRDEKFWDAWDKLGLDSAIMDAYSPPLPKPQPQRSVLQYLGQIASVLKGKNQKGKVKVKNLKGKGKIVNPELQEIQRAKIELERQRKAMEDELKRQRVMRERGIKEQKKREERQRKEQKQFEERQLKEAENKKKKQETVKVTQADVDRWSEYWYRLSYDEGVQYGLGAFFFVLFYQVVVLGYRKQQKDYEDRQKILKAESEERKKMKQLEYEMGVTDAALDSATMEGQGIVSGEDEEKLEVSEKNSDIKVGLQFMRSGARVRRVKGRRPPQYMDRSADVKFSDVAGLGDIRKELEEIVEFFRYGERYRRRGSKIPTGILLCGEPGTGKTLLAKAVAGEAGVNFFSISASQFVEIYVGVGASRVRALYQEARENAPAVVFIDELDAVGRQRGLIKGSGGQERDATLNQLLTCLDGFEGKGEVITIAATNRPDILDSALVRPGRFDRKIYIPKPGLIGRIEILKVHARNKPMADDIDYNAVANITEGMVGAQLANVLDTAAINIIRDGRTEITTDDLLEAAQLEERGLHDTRERSMDMWRKLALNEAALAVVSVNFPDMKNIQMITIAPRSGEDKGSGRIRMDLTKFEIPTVSRQTMLDHITVQLAPRAADEIWHGPDQLCTIWAGTADNARSAARELVFAGLSDKEEFYGLYNCWYEVNRINEVDVEALRILNMCYERAKKILQQNRRLMDAVIDELIRKKTLRKDEFYHLVEEYGHLDPIPPQLIEVRNASLAEFREKMMAGKHVSNSS